MHRVRLVRQLHRPKQRRMRSVNAASRDKQAATVQGEAQSSGRNERAFAVFRPIQKNSSLLKSPSGSILWRAGKGGIIERSTDAGKTWVSQMSPSKEDWLAGAAVSDTVCWMAGRNGAIARTMDGRAGNAFRRRRRPLELMPNCQIGPASRRAMRCPLRLGERRAKVCHGGRRKNLAASIAK